jgi:thiol-disulfide isomerase/thioredoxin
VRIRKAFGEILMLFLSLLLASSTPMPEMIPMDHKTLLGRTAPDFELKDNKGGTFTLSKKRGKHVVIAFWASWCGPCQDELPQLVLLSKRYPKVHFIAVDVDRNPAAGRRMLERMKLKIPVAFDPENKALARYDVASMPTSYIIDPKGTVKFRKVGYNKKDGLTQLENALAAMTRKGRK